MDVDVRIFFSDVLQKIDIPLKWQFRMVTPLHQDLNSARGRKFIEFLVDLFQRQNVMVFVPLGPVKSAELAVDVANVGVIDVAIRDVSHDLAPASAVTFFLGQISPGSCQRAEFFQWQTIKLQRFVGRNPFAFENFVDQAVAIQ